MEWMPRRWRSDLSRLALMLSMLYSMRSSCSACCANLLWRQPTPSTERVHYAHSVGLHAHLLALVRDPHKIARGLGVDLRACVRLAATGAGEAAAATAWCGTAGAAATCRCEACESDQYNKALSVQNVPPPPPLPVKPPPPPP